MKKIHLPKFALLFVCLLLANCSDDNDKNIMEGLEGTIVGTVSCNTEGNGLAYQIDIDNSDSIDMVITANLPNEFKQDGLKIKFDMEQSSSGLTACVSLYSPDIFYKLSNITTI